MLDRIKVLIEYCTSVEKFHLLCLDHGSWFRDGNMQLVIRACSVVEDEFKGEKRHSGSAVLTHMLVVAAILLCILGVRDVNVIVAAVLHDLAEDRSERWPIKRIANKFGFRVAHLVKCLTKRKRRPGEDKHQYETEVFAQVMAGGFWAIIIKLADRLHNILTPWGSREAQEAKIQETIRYVLPMARTIGVLHEELSSVCESELARLRNEVA